MDIKLAGKEADEIVGPLLEEAAFRVERMVSVFRICMASLFLVLHYLDGFGPKNAFHLLAAAGLSVILFSLWTIRQCETRSFPSPRLARISLAFDGFVFLAPAYAHSGHPDWHLVSSSPTPLLMLVIVTAGLRFSRPIANFGIGVGVAVLVLFVALDYARPTPPPLADVLFAVLLMCGSAIWATLASSETRRLVMQGAVSSFTANIDSLTGLRNRRFLRDHLDDALNQARSGERPLCVIMADIDHFKRVNDTYGHDMGDLVLKEVANTMKDALRGADLVARYGGEEFAFVLLDTELEQGCHVAERVRTSVEELNVQLKNHSVQPTLSLGVAQLSEIDEGIRGLLKRADEALYEAKENGRNRVKASNT